MKKHVVPLILSGVLLVSLPITVLSFGLALPSQFDETYYGELSPMYQRLKKASKKKIVLIGNSDVAFGVNSDLFNAEFPDYEVVNFGLYGAIGTKAMLDLSEAQLKEGDIAILLPEPYKQTSSLYFSASDAWRAIDSDHDLLFAFSWDDHGSMLGHFASYTAEKYSYWAKGEKPLASAPYSKASFVNESGENKGYVVYERPHNVMIGGYDSANLPLLSAEVFGSGFLSYLNEYAKRLSNKKVSTYFGFAPVNALSLDGDKQTIGDEFYDYLYQNLTFPIMGHPSRYFLDYRYFYDNNVHMNTPGMSLYTDRLVSDLKMSLSIPSPNHIEIPEPPEIPEQEIETSDNADEACFEYEERESATERYAQIVSLSEEGKARSSLTLPSSHNGLPVRGFDVNVFQNNKTISRIVLPKSIAGIEDYSFNGATRLSELVFRHDAILGLSMGPEFLAGADNCYIYVKEGVSLADCAGGWERYQSRIRYY